ncbi:hypothetical protein J5J83_09065 [Azoarcus sp. L1K30]|uniref:hypothetical protein n=1 Tax=Azoarcus sp. L1K30 TaxID=2820277 RepID=UPI001B81930C|nr:hypothetical protein [Azoarcus sp. L1K30]MBR0566263.1 hypothetical protein [Azoarcus sp. L1K30]
MPVVAASLRPRQVLRERQVHESPSSVSLTRRKNSDFYRFINPASLRLNLSSTLENSFLCCPGKRDEVRRFGAPHYYFGAAIRFFCPDFRLADLGYRVASASTQNPFNPFLLIWIKWGRR